MIHRSSRLVAFAFAAAFGGSAQAAIYTVGNGAGCTHGTIQSAINAANNSAGADTVRLTHSLTYEPEANTINTAQELTVEGGYATCTQASPDMTKTIVSGSGEQRLESALDAMAPALRSRRAPRAGLLTRLQDRDAAQPAWRWTCDSCDQPDCEHAAFRQRLQAGALSLQGR